MTIISTILINRPVKTVWDFFHSKENLQALEVGFKDSQVVNGVPGEVGSQRKHTFEDSDVSEEMIEEITHVIPYKEYHGILRHQLMVSNMKNVFHEKGQQTELQVTVQTEFKSITLKIISPIMRHILKRHQDKELISLKRVIESLT